MYFNKKRNFNKPNYRFYSRIASAFFFVCGAVGYYYGWKKMAFASVFFSVVLWFFPSYHVAEMIRYSLVTDLVLRAMFFISMSFRPDLVALYGNKNVT